MAFDPAYEDFRRLALAHHDPALDADPYEQTRKAMAFSQQFSWGNDALAVSDTDRAFHLGSEAAVIIDEELPFLPESEGAIAAADAQRLLEEALQLDEHCFDARRMLHAQTSPTMDDHIHFLTDRIADVERVCWERADRLSRNVSATDPLLFERVSLELAPLLRWIQSAAELNLLGGRYRKAYDLARRAIEIDRADMADSRYTAVLALAKLGDEDELEAFVRWVAPELGDAARDDAWIRFARMALAWQNDRLDEASSHIDWILATYPHAASALTLQSELPEPMFARLACDPYSNDEIVLAVSEATVLLQESADESGRGPFGTFVAEHPGVRAAYSRELEFYGESSEEVGGDDGEEA